MRSNHLAYTWKGVTTYVYTYILVTDKFSIEDIGAAQASGKKIVLWGWRPESFAVVCALKHAGISVDIACDVQQYEADFDFMGISVVNYKEILRDVNSYFFIVALRDYAEHVSVIKLLLYQGVDEFGIVYDSFSKDFNGNNLMQNIAVRLRGNKKVQNLSSMWYKKLPQQLATQGDFGHESP